MENTFLITSAVLAGPLHLHGLGTCFFSCCAGKVRTQPRKQSQRLEGDVGVGMGTEAKVAVDVSL